MRYLLLVLVASALFANAQPDYRKMSSMVRQAALESYSRPYAQTKMKSRGLGESRGLVHDSGRNQATCPLDSRRIMAFVRIDSGRAEEVLSRYGCRKHAQWGDICIAEIPLSVLAPLSSDRAVHRIEASRPASLLMDTTAAIINALPAYKPSQRHQAYTGEGVVLGIVDVGFDLTHPNFYDATLSRYRIGAFWDQLSADTIDSPMPVGRDYEGAEAIRAVGHSRDAEKLTHGTHTLGIVAGSGYDTPYRGIAFESEICAVGNAVNSNIEYVDSADRYKYTTALDALAFKYCMDYAERQGKPCVVSLSEGYPPYLDEEDSLYAAVLDSLSGPGRIIVASAGNGGVEKSYFEKPAESRVAGAFIRCFQQEALYRIKAEGDIRLSLYYYKEQKGAPSDTLAFETAEVPMDSILTKRLICSEDTLRLLVYRDYSRFGSDDVWQILVQGNQTLDKLAPMALVVEGEDRVEVYGNTIYAFTDRDTDDRWTAARRGRNINAPACFPSVICVGATAYRLSINNEEGTAVTGYNVDDGSVFMKYSSTGPAMNGLMKPDVMAPGTNVVSSFNHLFEEKKDVIAHSECFGERYPWGVQSGTSMSAPVVAGTIALWLQAKPDLTPADVRDILSRSCRQPDAELTYPNNTYGFGEIDAYKGLLDVLGLTAIEGLSLRQPSGVEIHPSEGGLRIVFNQTPTEPIYIKVYTLSGTCILSDSPVIIGPETFIPLPSPMPGIYAVQVESASKRLCGSQLVRL